MNSKGHVTLQDVAKQAGVSPTTASYILNGRSAHMRISTQTQDRVRAVAETLGYRPNRSAQSLRTATTHTIGLVSDFVASGSYASRMLTGASRAARRRDHLLVIGETEGDEDQLDALVDDMIARRVDAYIYATLNTSQAVVPEALARRRTVLLNCVDPSSPVPSVLPNEYEGGRAAATALLDAGIDSGIVVVGEDSTADALAGQERQQGVEARLDEVDAEVADRIPCTWDVEPAFDAVSAWLTAGGRASGLVCMNDRIAMGAYQALAQVGLSVPDDVSVVSFDNSELATWLRPRLTSVSLPYAEMGAIAVEVLLDPNGATSGITRVPMPVARGGSVRDVQ